MLLTGTPTPALDALLSAVATADALVLVTPIYSGAYIGMVKDLIDLLPEGALDGVPVLMGGTGGTARHALALDHTVRPLLGHVHAVVAPSAVFAATEDFGGTGEGGASLARRIAKAGGSSPTGDRPCARRARDPLDVTDFTDLLGRAEVPWTRAARQGSGTALQSRKGKGGEEEGGEGRGEGGGEEEERGGGGEGGRGGGGGG